MDVKEGIMGKVKNEDRFLKNIFKRIINRDFSGNTGQAIKNSSYQLLQNLIFKFGSLLFTIILARMLMPEKMGIYSLSLSIILFIAAFSDMGISSAAITFISKNLGKKRNSKAKAYFDKLFKWKLILLTLSAAFAIPLSFFVSRFIYPDKPIFFILLIGALYIPISGLVGFIEQIFKASNNFRIPLIKEIIFQVVRMMLIPAVILFANSVNILSQNTVFYVLLSITLIYSLVLFLLLIYLHKNKLEFLKSKKNNLNKKEILGLKNFIIPLSATSVAGLFFGYIDTMMLGYYITEKFIAYYSVAFYLSAATATIISFMSMSLMPILAKKSGKALDNIFAKSKPVVIMISLMMAVFVFSISNFIVPIIYGNEYLPAVGVLKLFAFLIFFIPVIGIYVSYFTVKKKTKEIASLMMASSLLNISLNFIGIVFGLNNFGEIGAVYGACIATIISRFVYLVGLVFLKKRN